MTKNDQFIANLKEMNSVMKADIKAGHQWTYSNKSSRKGKGFYDTRSKGKYHINCVDGPQWALRLSGKQVVPSNALSWFGGKGVGPVWLNANAERNARKYFDIYRYDGKYTLKQLIQKHRICSGDICVGFTSMNHTMVVLDLASGQGFDSGSGAYTVGHTGEDAVFKKWIGKQSCLGSRPIAIFRLKDRRHFIVQAGAYKTDMYKQFQQELKDRFGVDSSVIDRGGEHLVALGQFGDEYNANIYQKEFAKKGIACQVREV